MKKRILSILLTLCMVLMLFPMTALAEETPRIDITLSGFEVGNTPNDCTFTIVNSTVVGASVNIQEICWYMNDESGRHTMSNTEKFEPDTTYEVQFLTAHITAEQPQLPSLAVTVNGKTASVTCYGFDWGAHVVFDKLPTITIDGPDVVCAQQDYEFTATPPEGVTLDETFGYDLGGMGSGVELTIDKDGVGHGVLPAELFNQAANGFDVNAHGRTADGTFVSTTKHVEVSQEHIYVDGVCGCGEVLKYIVEYNGGAEFGLCADFKTYGKDLTLRGETFKRDGYVQTGWVDEKTGAVYALGDTYTENADVTLKPVFDKLITLTAPFTTTVKQGGDIAPGETTFELAVIGDSAPDRYKSDVTITGSVTTNGAGDYDGTLTLTGPEETLWYMLSEGAFVQQINAGEDGWTYDDTVWGLLLDEKEEIALLSLEEELEDEPEYILNIYPTICEETDDGTAYYNLNQNAGTVEKMRFTNTYTKSTTKSAESNQNTGATKSSQTGDNSNLFLWIALLFVGGFSAVGIGVYSKRRRSSQAK